MAWTIFNTVSSPATGAELDANLSQVASTGVTPCTASGTSAITLTPMAGGPPITAYSNYQIFSFIAPANPTGNVTLQINSLGLLPLYQLGTSGSQVGAGGLTAGSYYQVAYNSALDSGDGGFVLVSTAVASSALSVLRSYIAGLTLSNDSGTPDSVLDIAAGQCADSTNAVMINLGAFTKSTGGSWAAGSGGNGMGNGLTIADSTWYHVFAIINSGVPDVYFDTSVTAANAPSLTTAFRRIGSFKTDGSANILAFVQDEETFYWGAIIAEPNISNVTPSSSGTKYVLTGTPPGVKTRALIRIDNTTGGTQNTITSPDEGNHGAAVASTSPGQDFYGAGLATAVYTDTSQSIYVAATSEAVYGYTRGYIDSRGKFN